MVSYLNIFNYTLIPKLSLWAVSRRGEGVGGYVEERAVSVIRDIESSNGDYFASVKRRQQLQRKLTAVLVAEKEVTLLGPAVDDPHTHVELLASLPSRCGRGRCSRGALLKSRTAMKAGAGPCLSPGDGG